MPDPAVLLIEPTDFETFPVGGQLSMTRSLMKNFGNRLALVGMTRDEWPIGQWTEREISGTLYRFFSVGHSEPSAEKPFIPARLTAYVALRRFRRRILSLGCRAAFIQATEALLAVSHWDWDTICYAFPGIDNQLKSSRYALARPLWRSFDRALFSALDRVGLILASADQDAIEALIARSHGRLSRDKLIQMPTCVDPSIFYPVRLKNVRAELRIPEHCRVFVTCGRIARFKGWELLLDAFEEFLRTDSDALLIFVGDGEDRSRLEAELQRRHVESRVKVTGFQKPSQVASYLNAANVVVSGSLMEGWSVAMLEALACGKPIVTTQVSGASAMIQPKHNGFILQTRDPFKFSEAMRCALDLPEAEQVSTSIAQEYDIKRLGERMANLWPPFRQDECERNGQRPHVAARCLPPAR